MNRWKKLASENTGSEIAEAAVVLPLLFALLFGIVWFGRAFNIYATLNRAARAGAQAAATHTCAECGNQFDTDPTIRANIIDPILTAAHIDPSAVVVLPTQDVVMNPGSVPPEPVEDGKAVTITYEYNFRLNGLNCCPLQLAPINLGVTLQSTGKARRED